jgi:hypothetical protein
MVRSTAEGSDKIPVPHYRMHLRPLKHSDQHDLLRALESTGKKVYYAAPEFHASTDLNDAYLKNEMILRTAFFRPNAIGKLPDDDEHFVCFRAGSTFGYICSEPVEVDKTDSKEVRDILSNKNPEDVGTQLPARLYLRKLADELVSKWADRKIHTEETMNLLAEIRGTRGPREYLGWVAQTLFNCTVFVRLQLKDGQEPFQPEHA